MLETPLERSLQNCQLGVAAKKTEVCGYEDGSEKVGWGFGTSLTDHKILLYINLYHIYHVIIFLNIVIIFIIIGLLVLYIFIIVIIMI